MNGIVVLPVYRDSGQRDRDYIAHAIPTRTPADFAVGTVPIRTDEDGTWHPLFGRAVSGDFVEGTGELVRHGSYAPARWNGQTHEALVARGEGNLSIRACDGRSWRITAIATDRLGFVFVKLSRRRAIRYLPCTR